MEIKMVSIADIVPYENNAKKHPDDQVEHISNSIKEFGFRQPLVIDKDNVIVIGHGRLLAAERLGMQEVPAIYADDLTEAQINALRLADNKTNESEWDFSALDAELDDLRLDFDMSDFGFDIVNTDFDTAEEQKGSMKEKYLVPPFSVIYGNKPDWLERKRNWVKFGIMSEQGRGGRLVFQFPEWMGRQSPINEKKVRAQG